MAVGSCVVVVYPAAVVFQSPWSSVLFFPVTKHQAASSLSLVGSGEVNPQAARICNESTPHVVLFPQLEESVQMFFMFVRDTLFVFFRDEISICVPVPD